MVELSVVEVEGEIGDEGEVGRGMEVSEVGEVSEEESEW